MCPPHWQNFRKKDFEQSNDRVLLQLQDLADAKELISDALSFGLTVSFVSAPSNTRVCLEGGRRALRTYVDGVSERLAAMKIKGDVMLLLQ